MFEIVNLLLNRLLHIGHLIYCLNLIYFVYCYLNFALLLLMKLLNFQHYQFLKPHLSHMLYFHLLNLLYYFLLLLFWYLIHSFVSLKLLYYCYYLILLLLVFVNHSCFVMYHLLKHRVSFLHLHLYFLNMKIVYP